MKNFKYYTLFIFIINVNLIFGQSNFNSSKIITSAELQEDFLILKDSITKIHPDIYRYVNKTMIDSLFNSIHLSLNKDENVFPFYSKIKRLLSGIKDGHLQCALSNDDELFFNENILLFPIQIKFIKDKAYTISNSTSILEKGTEILFINEIPVKNIKKKLFEYIQSDGLITSNKYNELSDYFSFYHFLVYGQYSIFKISYLNQNGVKKTLKLKAKLNNIIDSKNKPDIEEKKLKLDFYNNEKVALITIKTFSYDELEITKENYRLFLSSTFKSLKNKKTNTLIIDLRNNGGGQDIYGSLLYSYLTNKEFKYYASLNTVNYELTSNDHPNLLVQNPQENNFRGKIYFLINGLSFSTTAELCSIAKSNNRGLFIGEETAGGYYGNNSGNFTIITLPNSKIIICIPTTKYVMAVTEGKENDRGIIPDYEITPTINDIIDKNDVQLNYALKLAKQK